MNTQTLQAAEVASPSSGSLNWFNRMAVQYDKSRYGAMAIMMTAQSCLGSVACLYILRGDAGTAMLTTGVMATMMSNSLFIAQSPAKWTIAGFIASIVINTALIGLNFFSS